jgi:hypothetical protein
MDWMPDGTSGRLLIAKGSGVNPAYDTIGNADITFSSDNTVDLAASASFTLPKGLWLVTTYSYYSSGGYYVTLADASLYIAGAWHNVMQASYDYACFIASDGVNARIYNTSSSYAITAYYKKVN